MNRDEIHGILLSWDLNSNRILKENINESSHNFPILFHFIINTLNDQEKLALISGLKNTLGAFK